jgi:inorganic triphosphatase YgiF
MNPTSSREVELKFRVPTDFALPDLVLENIGIARAKREVTRHLHSIYYDTADFRLFRWGVTLRRREGGHDAGWHMKLPVQQAAGYVRDELGLPLEAGAPTEVPSALVKLIVPYTRGAELIQVAELRNERVPYLLYDGVGTAVVELVDDHVTLFDDGQPAESFREIEVEALVEDISLEKFAGPLIDAGAHASTSSKAAAAFGSAATAGPDIPKPAEVEPSDPARLAIAAFLQLHIRAFIAQDVRVRRDLPDAVHQMRVSARRLRSGLKAFGPLLDEAWAEHLRDELGWAASELGDARDTEVLLARLDAHADDLGNPDSRLVRAVIDPQLEARLAAAREFAIKSLSTRRHVALLDELVAAANNPRVTELADEACRDVLPELVERTFRRLERRVAGLRLEGPANTWHEARIAAKRARYTADAVAIVFGAPARRLAAALSEVTEVLGEHQDACIAQDVLRELASTDGIDGRTGFALGLLHEHEFEQELHARLQFERVWPAVQRVQKQSSMR